MAKRREMTEIKITSWKASKERKKKNQCKKGQKIEIDIFTKKIYRWPTGT